MGTEKPHNEMSNQERCQVYIYIYIIFFKLIDLNSPTFEGRKTCKDTVCYRRPTLNSSPEWLAGDCAAFSPLSGHPPSSAKQFKAETEATGAETLSLVKRLFSRKQVPSVSHLCPGFSQPFRLAEPAHPATHCHRGTPRFI